MGRKIVAYWDCSSCGTKGITGESRTCPNCGKPRGDDVTFYMKEDTLEVVEDESKVSSGPDWLCSFCNTLNSSDDVVCKSCGASREDSEKNYFTMHQKPAEPVVERPVKKRGSCWKILAIVAAVIVLFNLVTLFLARPKTSQVQIQDMSWTATEDVEDYKTYQESDWSMPEGGRLLRTAQEVSGYSQVLDHYETVEKSRQVPSGSHEEVTGYTDLGNGYFEEQTTTVTDYTTEYYTEEEPVYRDEPIYSTKYYYEIERWKYNRTLTEQGNDKNPHYKEETLASNERITNQQINYMFSYTDEKGKVRAFPISEETFREFNTGDMVYVTLSLGELQSVSREPE